MIKEINEVQEQVNSMKKENNELNESLKEKKSLYEIIGKKELDEFNPDLFNALIDRVIVGGINQDNVIDPYLISFVFKSGSMDLKIPSENISLSGNNISEIQGSSNIDVEALETMFIRYKQHILKQ